MGVCERDKEWNSSEARWLGGVQCQASPAKTQVQSRAIISWVRSCAAAPGTSLKLCDSAPQACVIGTLPPVLIPSGKQYTSPPCTVLYTIGHDQTASSRKHKVHLVQMHFMLPGLSICQKNHSRVSWPTEESCL